MNCPICAKTLPSNESEAENHVNTHLEENDMALAERLQIEEMSAETFASDDMLEAAGYTAPTYTDYENEFDYDVKNESKQSSLSSGSWQHMPGAEMIGKWDDSRHSSSNHNNNFSAGYRTDLDSEISVLEKDDLYDSADSLTNNHNTMEDYNKTLTDLDITEANSASTNGTKLDHACKKSGVSSRQENNDSAVFRFQSQDEMMQRSEQQRAYCDSFISSGGQDDSKRDSNFEPCFRFQSSKYDDDAASNGTVGRSKAAARMASTGKGDKYGKDSLTSDRSTNKPSDPKSKEEKASSENKYAFEMEMKSFDEFVDNRQMLDRTLDLEIPQEMFKLWKEWQIIKGFQRAQVISANLDVPSKNQTSKRTPPSLNDSPKSTPNNFSAKKKQVPCEDFNTMTSEEKKEKVLSYKPEQNGLRKPEISQTNQPSIQSDKPKQPELKSSCLVENKSEEEIMNEIEDVVPRLDELRNNETSSAATVESSTKSGQARSGIPYAEWKRARDERVAQGKRRNPSMLKISDQSDRVNNTAPVRQDPAEKKPSPTDYNVDSTTEAPCKPSTSASNQTSHGGNRHGSSMRYSSPDSTTNRQGLNNLPMYRQQQYIGRTSGSNSQPDNALVSSTSSALIQDDATIEDDVDNEVQSDAINETTSFLRDSSDDEIDGQYTTEMVNFRPPAARLDRFPGGTYKYIPQEINVPVKSQNTADFSPAIQTPKSDCSQAVRAHWANAQLTSASRNSVPFNSSRNQSSSSNMTRNQMSPSNHVAHNQMPSKMPPSSNAASRQAPATDRNQVSPSSDATRNQTPPPGNITNNQVAQSDHMRRNQAPFERSSHDSYRSPPSRSLSSSSRRSSEKMNRNEKRGAIYKKPIPPLNNNSHETTDEELARNLQNEEYDDSSISSEPTISTSKIKSGVREGSAYEKFMEAINKDFDNNLIDKNEYENRVKRLDEAVTKGIDEGWTTTPNAVSILRRLNKEGHIKGNVLFSEETDHIAGCFGDKGYACGYRCTQMLFSAMRRKKQYMEDTFNNSNSTPSIWKIQALLENAWFRGFDNVSKAQFNGKMSDTQNWLGAIDVIAILSSIGVKCRMVDFMGGQQVTHRIVVTRLLTWFYDYFTKSRESDPCLPVFVQSPGHSFLVVGIVIEREMATALVVLESGCPFRAMRNLKDNQGLSQQLPRLIKTADNLQRHGHYQVIEVNGVLANEAEYNRAKQIDNLVEEFH